MTWPAAEALGDIFCFYLTPLLTVGLLHWVSCIIELLHV